MQMRKTEQFLLLFQLRLTSHRYEHLYPEYLLHSSNNALLFVLSHSHSSELHLLSLRRPSSSIRRLFSDFSVRMSPLHCFLTRTAVDLHSLFFSPSETHQQVYLARIPALLLLLTAIPHRSRISVVVPA